jgi:hypothetical protein
MRLGVLIVAAAAAALTAGASAQDKSQKIIKTGGSKGAYHTQFCPPLEPKLRAAQFSGYRCTACQPGEPCGSPANIDFVMKNPASIAPVQLDVYARAASKDPKIGERTTIVKQVACESVIMITKNPAIQNYGDVLGLARRLPFVVADGGSTATFDYMKEVDPEGIGRARNVEKVADGAAVVQTLANNPDAVGMFVQFADGSNANIKAIAENKLHALEVSSRELARAKVGDVKVYDVRPVHVGGKDVKTLCTPVAFITGKPEAFTSRDEADDQRDLIAVISKMNDADLLPKEGTLASLLRNMKSLSSSALDELNDLVDKAKQAAEKRS